MTLLTICQDAAGIIGIPQPTAIINATDTSSVQLLQCANQEGKALARDYPWNILMKEGSFTTSAAESQGLMTTIESDFARILNDTLWNRTTDRKYFGPINDSFWQQLKATVTSGASDYFRIRGGKLLIHPTPTASQSVFFEYISKYWIDSGSDSVGDLDKFAADTNISLIDEYLVTLGVVWRFLKLKGLPYDQQFLEYQQLLKTFTAQDGAKAIYHGNNMGSMSYLAANVPDGNFG